MSHHLDSPLARQDVRLDITDLYVFRGEIGTVFAFNVCHSIAGDIPEPGFHPEGKYEVNLGVEPALTYRFTFAERDGDGRQRFSVHGVRGGSDHGGHGLAEGTTDEVVHTADGSRVWAGRAGDPFWIEPDVLHAVGHAFQDGTTVDLSGWNPEGAHNLFAGHSVYSVVMEVPDVELLAHTGGRRDIHVWARASLATDAGGWRSVNRIGLPMIHPLFTQFDEDLGDRLNLGHPQDDPDVFGEVVVAKIAGVVRAYGTAADPDAYARSVARRFLPNALPYRVGTPASFGFAEWNGRALTDNAPNVMFTIAANSPVSLGIGKESVTSKPVGTFPHLPKP
ncbi:DUF4331 family protein [Kutzneria sp. NPDC051319]|uniref:DUF4331 family protein n=1 Tax=Kutzneria sp. NPDC051319 TaxID=3155047 RepID=UPI00344AD0F1